MTCRTRLATVLAGVSECQSIRLPSNDSLSTQWGVSEHVGRRAIQSMDGWVGVRYNKTAGDTICFSVSLFLFHCCPNMGDGKPSGGVPAKLKSCFVNIAIGGFVVIFCNLQFRRLPPKLMTAIKSDLIKC